MKRMRWLLAATWLAILAWAAPRVDANPDQAYALTPQAGEWLVCAASYTGPEARDLAVQLATWIRAKFRTPVYLYNRSDEERQRLNAEYASRGVKKHVRVQDQVAVLVGGYADLDKASQARDVVRKWPLPELKLASGKPAFDMETIFKTDANGKQVPETHPVNPFASALTIRNPLAPKASQRPKFDPILTKLNQGEDFSLLNNSRPWTLAVKQYAGGSVMTDQQVTTSLWDRLFGSNGSQALDAAGKQAHELARVLRKLGFEAWVLHTRSSSVVTVGGFDRVDDPEIGPMRARLTQLTQQVINASQNRQDPFQLFAMPLPMEVPRAAK